MTDSGPAIERADNLLAKTQDTGGATHMELTAKNFVALTKSHGFTTAVAAEVASRARAEAAADRKTVRLTAAASHKAQRADKILLLAAVQQQAGGRVQNGTLALNLDDIAANQISYERRLRQQALLSEHLAPLFTSAATALQVWERQTRARAFQTRKAANAAYRRHVNRPIAMALRVLGSEGLLQSQTTQARRSLRNSIRTLAVLLRYDSNARQEARQLVRADPQGFLASKLKPSA